MNKPLALILATSAALLTACAQTGQYVPNNRPTSGNLYQHHESLNEMQVRYGEIVGLRPVSLEKNETGAGLVGGAVLGGLAGNSVGKGRGRKLATIAGVIGGAMAGSAIERTTGRSDGVEIAVRMNNGQEVAVVQNNDQDLRVGDRVRLTTTNGHTRVSR